MKSFSLLLMVLLHYSICALPQQQDDNPWAKYLPRKLSEVIKANNSADMQQQQGVAIVVGSSPFKARVIYRGQFRPIPEDKKSLIKLWMQSNNYSEDHFQMFAEELLFREDGIEYWLPVQSVLIPHFKRELSKGESLDLFAAWIGVTFAEPGKREHVFLVNEFEKADKKRVKRRGVL
jgi:hypothetical protein